MKIGNKNISKSVLVLALAVSLLVGSVAYSQTINWLWRNNLNYQEEPTGLDALETFPIIDYEDYLDVEMSLTGSGVVGYEIDFNLTVTNLYPMNLTNLEFDLYVFNSTLDDLFEFDSIVMPIDLAQGESWTYLNSFTPTSVDTYSAQLAIAMLDWLNP